MAAVDPDELATVVADALAEAGRSLDDLTATEAIEIADALRAIVAALPRAHDPRQAPSNRHRRRRWDRRAMRRHWLTRSRGRA